MDELYIKLEWPEYQLYMHYPNIFYCPDADCYFVPKTLFENDKIEETLLNVEEV